MRGSYLNDPCRELRDGEPDDPEPSADVVKLADQWLAEWLGRSVYQPSHARSLAALIERYAADRVNDAVDLTIKVRESVEKAAPRPIPFPFGSDVADPATCRHQWEPHLYERGVEYCPYCTSTRGRPAGRGA